MNENEKNFLSEIARRAGEEIKEQVAAKFGLDAANPDPDPETVKMLEELEAKKSDPDELLLGAMEDVCDLINLTIAEAEEWGASTAQMLEIDEKVNEMAKTVLSIYKCIEAKNGLNEARSMLDKLHLMRDVEARNDQRIKEWSEGQ